MAKIRVDSLRQTKQESGDSDWRGRVIDALLHGSSITAAAHNVGMGRARIYDECCVNPPFKLAFKLARYYGRNRILCISRPIWPPTIQAFQRHEDTFRRINAMQCYQLVGSGKWN